jgi:hypothetical protein
MRTLAIVVTLSGAMLHAAPTHATLPLRSHIVVGCVVYGQFVLYANQGTIYSIVKLPYWVRKSGGNKLEGQEIRLRWSAFSAKVPNYVFERNRTRWELVGPCDHSQMPAPSTKPRS